MRTVCASARRGSPARPHGVGGGLYGPRYGRLVLVVALLLLAGPVLFGGLAPADGGAGASLAAALPALTGVLVAQQPRAGREGCDLVSSRRLNSILNPSGERVTYISGPLAFQCDDGTRIRADSVVDFQATRFRQLMGGVEIDGPETRLVADRVHRSDDLGRIEAWGSVEVEQKGSDTRMAGDSLVFFESGPSRAESELDVFGDRPYAVLRLGGEGDGPAETPPDTVFGDRLHLVGESRFVATGDVHVRRSEMDAFGDSLDFARDESVAHLFGTGADRARIEGEEFDLEARRVDLFLQGDALEEVRAVERARLTGEDVEMEAPRIRIFMSGGETERLVAVRETPDAGADTVVMAGGPEREVETVDGAPEASDRTAEAEVPGPAAVAADRMGEGRPTAVAEDFVLWGDSIEVSAPGQRLERVYAVGRARGESLARDSLNTPDMPEMIRRDWIEGDTIVAHFVPVDTAGGEDDPSGADEDRPAEPREAATADQDRPEYALDRLIATGNARSLYRLAPQDSVSVVSVEDGEVPADGGPEPGADGGDREVAGAGGAGAAGDTVTVLGTPPGQAADSTGASPERPRRRPAVHYVVGSRITIVLADGEVDRMEVQGQTRGLYLEPLAARSSGRTP